MRGVRGERAGSGAAASLLIFLAGLVAGCGMRPQASEAEVDASPAPDRFEGPAIISGTAIEASTGRPLAGVELEGPGGVQAVTDAEGRFEIVGLATGLSGFLRAWTESGLEGKNRLRPLESGRLEVVVYLR